MEDPARGNGRHTEGTADLLGILGAAFESKHGAARHHAEARQLRKTANDALGQTFAEVFHLGVAAGIGKRQDRQRTHRAFRFRCGRGRNPVPRLVYLDPRLSDVFKAMQRILRQAAAQQPSHAGRRRGRQSVPIRLAFKDGRDRLEHRFAAKGRAARQHLVEDAAERPDVGVDADGFPARLLRAHIRRCADDPAFNRSRRGQGGVVR